MDDDDDDHDDDDDDDDDVYYYYFYVHMQFHNTVLIIRNKCSYVAKTMLDDAVPT